MGRGKFEKPEQTHPLLEGIESSPQHATAQSAKRIVGKGFIEIGQVGDTGIVLLQTEGVQSVVPTLSAKGMTAFRQVPQVKGFFYPIMLQAADISKGKRRAFAAVWNYLVRHRTLATSEQLIDYLHGEGITTQTVKGGRAKASRLDDPTLRNEVISEMTFRLKVPLVNEQGSKEFKQRGYKLAESREEANAYAAGLRSRAEKQIEAGVGIKSSLDKDSTFRSGRLPKVLGYSPEQVEHVVSALSRDWLKNESLRKYHVNLPSEDKAKEIRSDSQLRDFVHAMRVAGIPIAGYPHKGYRVCRDKSETEAYLDSLRERVLSQRERAKCVEEAAALWYPETDEERLKFSQFISAPQLEGERSQAEVRLDARKAKRREEQQQKVLKQKTRAATARLTELEKKIGSTKPAERDHEGRLRPPKGAGAFYRVKFGQGSKQDRELVDEYKACRAFVRDGRIPKGLNKRQRRDYGWLPPKKGSRQGAAR